MIDFRERLPDAEKDADPNSHLERAPARPTLDRDVELRDRIQDQFRIGHQPHCSPHHLLTVVCAGRVTELCVDRPEIAAPLAVATTVEVYLVGRVVAQSIDISIGAAVVTIATFVGCWIILPTRLHVPRPKP